MADRVLFVGWTRAARGREQLALEAFESAMGMYGRMQQEGRIESFDVVLLTSNPDLDGYVQVNGSAEQLAAVREDEEFQRSIVAAELAVDGMRVVDGYANEGIAYAMGLYQEAVAKTPQVA